MELTVVARTHPRIGGATEGFGRGERGHGAGAGGYSREM